MLAYSGAAVIVPAGPIGPRGWWMGRAGWRGVVSGVDGGALRQQREGLQWTSSLGTLTSLTLPEGQQMLPS